MLLKYPESESKTLEFKSDLPRKFDNLIKTCVAFANGAGGQIIFGINDSKEIIGINDSLRERILEDFPNSLYDSTSPALIPRIYEKNLGAKSLLIVEILASPKKPCLVSSEGIPAGVYIRVGSSTRKADENYIEELYRENRRINYDEEGVYEKNISLNSDLLKAVYPKWTSKQLINEKILLSNKHNPTQSFPTVAGILLFNENPEKYLPEAYILCSRMKGSSGREIIQKEEITGNLEKQILDTFNLLRLWLSRDYTLNNLKLKARTLIPETVLREAVINAVLHRKYSIPGPIKIALFEDRLEIFNPGAFPAPIDIKNLGDGTTCIRNPIISKVFRKLNLVEKMGSGIKLIFHECQKAKLKAPEYTEGGDFVKLTFFFNQIKEANLDDNTAILNFLKNKKYASPNEIAILLGVSRNTLTKKMNALIELNKVIRLGKGPATKYTLPDLSDLP